MKRPLSDTHFVDRRWGPRLRIDRWVTLICEEGARTAVLLKNASLTGGYVTRQAHVREGQRVVVEVDFPCQAARELPPIPAVVVRLDDTGIGIEWEELGSDAVLAVLTLLAQEPWPPPAPRG
jgi:hypothetical protein